MASGNQIKFGVGYQVDKSSVQKVKQSLKQLQNIKIGDFKGTRQELNQVKDTAKQIEIALEKAFNVNIGFNTQRFNQELGLSASKVNQIYTAFSKAGAQGQVAFNRMASSILTTNLQLKETRSLLTTMGQTMVNTVKWGIASSVMNTFTNSVRQAVEYVKSLDSALTDIRIVTGDSAEKMKDFSVQANQAAQSLGRSTMDYTKAALTFYQQGLSDEDVAARTQATLVAQNITGAGQEMADYLTAVWNGYKVANEEAELYVDKLAAVADSSASNMAQLATAMSKVASTANMLGVPVDKLNAQIATITATTRQAPETVGNALKTIYARINDIATGADDAQISLGNYSEKMAEVGFSVLDANGRLRDTGDVIDEIGAKWETLSREQQIYLARTMAGQRQYNNLLALFENWGKYSELVTISMDAQGAAMEKNERYMDSLAAKMEQFGAAGERVKSALVNENDLKRLTDVGTGLTNLFANFIESIGGGSNALIVLVTTLTTLFRNVISKQINNIITNIQIAKDNAAKLKQDVENIRLFGNQSGFKNDAITAMVEAKEKMAQYYSLASVEQINSYNNLVKQVGETKNQIILLEQKQKLARQYNAAMQQVAKNSGMDISEQFGIAEDKIAELKESLESLDVGQIFSRIKETGDLTPLQPLIEEVRSLKNQVGDVATNAFAKFEDKVQTLGGGSDVSANKIRLVISAAKDLRAELETGVSAGAALESINQQYDIAKAKAEQAKQAAQDYLKTIQQFASIKGILDGISSLGRFASALNSLANLKNIWSNQNLSASQKFLQTLTSIGFAIPMLVTSLGKLNTITKAWSVSLLTGNKIQAAQTALTTAQTAVEKAHNVVIEKQKILSDKRNASYMTTGVQKNAIKIATHNLEMAERAETNAIREQTVAQQQLNAAQKANPIGLIITVAAAAIFAAVKAYDALTMSAKEAAEAIQNFNQKQKETSQHIEDFSKGQASLEEVKEEYEDLAQKAGAINFDSNIDDLTQKQRTRYNEIKQLVKQYNEEAVSGYTKQGQAILKNNDAIQETIRLLQEQKQAEIDLTYNGPEYEKAQQGRQKQYKDALEKQDALQNQLSNLNQDTYGHWEQAFTNFKNDFQNSDLARTQTYLNLKTEVMNFADKRESFNSDLFNTALQNFKNYLAENDPTESYVNAVDRLSSAISQYFSDITQTQIDIALNEKDVDEKSKFDTQAILGRLQVTGNNKQYNDLASMYGENYVKALIKNYIQGFQRGMTTSDGVLLKTEDDVIQYLKEHLLTPLEDTFTEDDFKKLSKSITEKFSELDLDSLTSEQYYDQIKNFINQVFGDEDNQELQKLAKKYPEALETVLSTLFNLSDITFKYQDTRRGMSITGIDSFQDANTKAFKDAQEDALDTAKKWIRNNFEELPKDINIAMQQQLDNIIKNSSKEDLQLFTPEFFDELGISDMKIYENGEVAFLLPDGFWYSAQQSIERLYSLVEDAREGVKNYNQTISELGTLSLLGNKDDLKDDQLEQLQKGLNELIQTYPELQGAVQILNNEWLEGTSMYQRALHDVSTQIFENAQASIKAKDIEQTQVSAYISSFINDVETLQDALNKQLLTNEDYSQALIRMASGYENCSQQLNRYLLALNSGTQETLKDAEETLALSIRIGELSEQTGISADQIEKMSDVLRAQNDALARNGELAADAAVRYIKLNTAVSDIYDNLEDYQDLLSQINENGIDSIYANEDLYNSFDTLKEAIADIFDTSSELLGDDWVVRNMDNIFKMVETGGEGLRELQELAAQEIFLNIGINTDEFISDTIASKEDFLNAIAEMEDGADISLNLDLLLWTQQLVTAMQQAGYAQADIENALSGIGIDVDLAPYEAGLNQAIDDAEIAGQTASDYFAQNAGVDVKTNTQTTVSDNSTTIPEHDYDIDYAIADGGTIPVLDFSGSRNGLPTRVQQIPIRMSYPVYRPKKKSTTIEGQVETAATALEVIGAHKSSGGNISHYNSPTSRANRAAKKSSSGGGGSKGSSGSAKQPSIAKISTDTISTKPKQTPYNPYEEIEKSYERQEDLLKDLDDLEKHLQGEDRLNNIQQQNKELIKQNSIIEERQKISEDAAEQGTTAWYRNQLLIDEALKDVVKFDPDGKVNETVSKQAITNAFNTQLAAQKAYYEAAQNSYNNWIENVWNKYSGEEQQANKKQKQQYDEDLKNAKKNAQDKIKVAEEEYNSRIKLLENYQKALEEDQKFYENYLDNIEKLIENRIAESKIKVDLAFDFGQTERQWQEFENKFIKRLNKDDIFANAKASFRELQSYFNSSEITQAQKEIDKVRKEIALIQSGQYSGLYGITQQEFNNLSDTDRNNLQKKFLDQATEDLQTYQKKLMDSLEEVQDKQEEIQEFYLDSIDKAKDKMDEVVEQYERINDLVEHNIKLTELLYGDNAGYDIRDSYYSRQSLNNSQMIQTLRQQQAYWQSQLDNAMAGTEDWNKFKENLENVTDAINSALENQLTLLATKFENKIQGALSNIQNKLTNGLGNAFLDSQWDYISKDDSAFLDIVNSKFGIDEVERLYSDAAADAAGNITQQQRINKLMNDQLKLLREKDKLTQYDIDRAKAALEVEKARMALEEARNNKSKMRLRRDSQGNYTYQYVADEEKLSDLQSALADAESQLYNMDKEHYQQQLNEMYNTYKDYLEKRADLEREMQATQDENEQARIKARIKLLEEAYTEYADNITDDLQFTLSNYLTESAAAGLGVDLSQYSTIEQVEFLKDNLPYVNTEIQNLADTITGEQGIFNSTKQYLDELTAAFQEYNDAVEDTLTLAGTSVLSIASTIDDQTIGRTEEWLGLYQDAALETQTIIQNMQQLIEEMQKFMNEDFSSSDVIQSLYKAEEMIEKILNPDQIDEMTTLAGSLATIGYGTLGADQDIGTLTDEQRQELLSLQEDYLAQQADFNTLADELALSDIDAYTENILENADEILESIYNTYKDDLKNRLEHLLLQEINSLSDITNTVNDLNNSQTLDQNVAIEAHFPNVTNHTEIEEAFNNLVNMASQKAAIQRT